MSPAFFWAALIFSVEGFMFTCFCGLIVLLADGEVFTRAAFADLRLMASRAMHRKDRVPFRERLRDILRDRSLPLDDLEAPLESEPYGPPCLLCMGSKTQKPCCCHSDCGAVQCSGRRQSA